jgi:hypothetical protein
MTNTDSTATTGYQRALAAEPQLQPIVQLVKALCTLARPTDRMCDCCVWDLILKPLAKPWLGLNRGKLPEQATDDPPWIIRPPVRLGEVIGPADSLILSNARGIPATTETETWLRTPEAHDAFTKELRRQLCAAGPRNGHGISKGTES